MIDLFASEQILENWNLSEAWNSAVAPLVLVLEDPAYKIDFAFFQPNLMIDFSLADDRLGDAADINRICLRCDIHRHLQGDVAIQMHSRLQVDIDADVQVLELRVNQWIDADASNARLK